MAVQEFLPAAQENFGLFTRSLEQIRPYAHATMDLGRQALEHMTRPRIALGAVLVTNLFNVSPASAIPSPDHPYSGEDDGPSVAHAVAAKKKPHAVIGSVTFVASSAGENPRSAARSKSPASQGESDASSINPNYPDVDDHDVREKVKANYEQYGDPLHVNLGIRNKYSDSNGVLEVKKVNDNKEQEFTARLTKGKKICVVRAITGMNGVYYPVMKRQQDGRWHFTDPRPLSDYRNSIEMFSIFVGKKCISK